jgi:hypothetical protein
MGMLFMIDNVIPFSNPKTFGLKHCLVTLEVKTFLQGIHEDLIHDSFVVDVRSH